MGEQVIVELTRKELNALREFLATLKDERDAIISFSLEGIIQENNKKEEILRKLEYLEREKESLLDGLSDASAIEQDQKFSLLRQDIDRTAKEVRISMEKNMKLLSFSMDHVKSTIERIVGFINRSTYGKSAGSLSFVISREV